jgi:hypothetical protein
MTKHRWCAALVLSFLAWNTAAATHAVDKFGLIHSAVSALLPKDQFSISEGAEGDLNGDGVSDYAAVVALSGGEGRREERLVVLAGVPDGSYKPISVSGPFCEAAKFYSISVERNALVVDAVGYADASRSSRTTRQFRYNPKIHDLELIGMEESSVEYDENSSYKVSVNYLTKVVHYARHLGSRYVKRSVTADGVEKVVEYSRRSGKHQEAKARFDHAEILRLQGFDCADHTLPDTGVSIDENFKVRTRKVAP